MGSQVEQMFGRIAGVYDLLNHTLSLGIDRSWRSHLADLACASPLLRAEKPLPLLPLADLAAGTMDVSLALAARESRTDILAMDFCSPMLERGLHKLAKRALRRRILPVCADATALPLPDNSAAAITMAFGIRNIRPREAAFREMRRVLAPGGRACILEFGSAGERIWGGLYNFYLMRILPGIGRIIARDKQAYSYLARTIREFPPAPALAAEMEAAGLKNARFRKLTGGIVCLHWAEKEGAVSARP